MPYSEKYNGTISVHLTPTLKNVVRAFIDTTMRNILLDDKTISFNFVFTQPEAITFIEQFLYQGAEGLKDEEDWYEARIESDSKIMQALKQESKSDNDLPSLIINDYQTFFELFRQYHEKNIELWFQRTKASGFMVYEMKNCFEHIWLRATPEDFNNPEQFLEKQVQIINDNTFSKYDDEIVVGELGDFNDHILCVSNDIARTWDETPREFKMTIYDKEIYDTEIVITPRYTLPLIRYGIYERDGEKVCLIGAIQSSDDGAWASKEVTSTFNRTRYRVNKGIPANEALLVEPSHLIALSIFINFLHNEGITKIEAPSCYVLDYQYHQKRNMELIEELQKEWPKSKQEQYPDEYIKVKQRIEEALYKEDLICYNKTTRFIQTLMRLAHHYPKSQIPTDPTELDNYFHMTIPVAQEPEDINNVLLQSLKTLVGNLSQDSRNDISRKLSQNTYVY